MENAQAWWCLAQAGISGPSNVTREAAEKRIRDRICEYSEDRMRRYREEDDMAINEM